jgi:hypothetical protein
VLCAQPRNAVTITITTHYLHSRQLHTPHRDETEMHKITHRKEIIKITPYNNIINNTIIRVK